MDVITKIYETVAGGSKPKAGPSLVERLPQDVIVLILQSINSLRSLRATVLASSAMYIAFKTAKTEILACVVSHSRPEEIKSDAAALLSPMILHEQRHSNLSRELIIDSVINPQRVWAYGPRDLSSPQSLHFHWFVEFFTEKLFKSAMREVYRRGWSGTEKLKFRRLSQNETIRIQRALYRYEFFNSFMRLNVMHWSGLLATSYWRSNVSVWDMEEMACIYQFLWQRLSVLDEKIINIVENTTLFCRHRGPGARKDEGCISSAVRVVKKLILSQGLATLYRLLTRPESQFTRHTILEILRASVRPGNKPEFYTIHQVCGDVTVFAPDSLFDQWSHSQYPCTLHIDRLRIPKESVDYPSFGYVRAYRTETLKLVKAGQMTRTESTLYHQVGRTDDRNWGYCLWDRERMEWWGENSSLMPQLRECSQLRVTSRGSPRWHTVQLNPGAEGG